MARIVEAIVLRRGLRFLSGQLATHTPNHLIPNEIVGLGISWRTLFCLKPSNGSWRLP